MNPTIKQITPPTVELHSYEDGLLGVVNEYEFFEFRVQIKKKFKGEPHNPQSGFFVNCPISGKADIDTDGRMHNYPESFDMLTNYLMELF